MYLLICLRFVSFSFGVKFSYSGSKAKTIRFLARAIAAESPYVEPLFHQVARLALWKGSCMLPKFSEATIVLYDHCSGVENVMWSNRLCPSERNASKLFLSFCCFDFHPVQIFTERFSQNFVKSVSELEGSKLFPGCLLLLPFSKRIPNVSLPLRSPGSSAPLFPVNRNIFSLMFLWVGDGTVSTCCSMIELIKIRFCRHT